MKETIGAAQVELGVDASGVDAGVARAKRSIETLGAAGSKAGREAGKGMDEAGRAGADAAQKLDAATKRMIASIERQTAAIGKSKSDYYAAMAAINGNASALGPYIEKLRAAEQAHAGMAASMDRVKGLAVTAATAMAAVAVAGAVGLKGMIDSADAINDMSQRLGIGVRALAAYDLAARQSGASLESIGKGIKALAVNMVDHGDALRAAGITAKDADGALRQLADLFAGMPDGIEKTALATKLFGKAGLDLIPLLNLGSKGLNESAEKSAKYAAAMELLAPQADRFNDNMSELAMNSKLAGMSLLNNLLPRLSEITAAMALAAQEGGILKAALVGFGGIVDAVVGKPRRTMQDVAGDIDTTTRAIGNLEKGSKTYEAQVAALNAQLARLRVEQQGLAGGDDTKAKKPKALDDVEERYKKLLAALKVGQGAAAAAESEYDKIIKKIREKVAAVEEEATVGRALYEEEKFGLDIRNAMAAAAGKLTESERQRILAESELAQIGAKRNRLAAEERKSFDERKKAMAGYVTEAERMVEAAGKETEKLKEQLETLGLSAEQLTEYRVRKLEAAAASELFAAAELDAAAVLLDEAGALPEVAGGYRQLASARRAAAAQMNEQGGMVSAIENGSRALAEQSELWRSIDRTAHDTFVSIFDGGKNFAQRLKDTLKNVLFDWLYQMTARKWLINLSASVSGTAVASNAFGAAASSSGGGLGGIGGFDLGGFNPISLISGTDFGAGLMSGIGELIGGASFVGPSASLAGGAVGMGGALGAALPWIGGALALASAFGMFEGDGPAMRTSNYSAPFGAGATSGNYNYPTNHWFSASMGPDQTAFDKQLEEFEKSLITSLGLTADQITNINAKIEDNLGKQYNFGMEGDATTIDPAIMVDRMVFALEESGKQWVDMVKATLDSAGAAKALDHVASFGLIDAYSTGDPFQAATDALAASSRTLMGQWMMQRDVIDELVTSFDGGVDSTAALAAATKTRYDLEIALAQQIQQVVTGAHDMVANSIRTIDMSVLDNEGKYNYLDDEAARYQSMLASMTDPAMIASYAGKLNDTIMQAWQLLSPDEQRRLQGEYTDRLRDIDDLVARQAQVAADTARDDRAALVSAIDAAMQRAADAIAAAASAPTNIHVTVTVDDRGTKDVQVVNIG